MRYAFRKIVRLRMSWTVLILTSLLTISCSTSSSVTRRNTAAGTKNKPAKEYYLGDRNYHDLMTDCLDCFIRDSVKTAMLDSVVIDCGIKAERNRVMGRYEGAGVIAVIVIVIKLLTL